MTEQRAVCTMPAFSEQEAKILFVYHLQMASHLFELLPEGYVLPITAFDDYSVEAANEFLRKMEAAYQAVEDQSDDAC